MGRLPKNIITAIEWQMNVVTMTSSSANPSPAHQELSLVSSLPWYGFRHEIAGTRPDHTNLGTRPYSQHALAPIYPTNHATNYSEDCLSVNIWTNANPSTDQSPRNGLESGLRCGTAGFNIGGRSSNSSYKWSIGITYVPTIGSVSNLNDGSTIRSYWAREERVIF